MNTNEQHARAERAIAEQQAVTAELVAIRDAITRPQQHTTVRGKVTAECRQQDADAYTETLIDFQAWCETHDVSFRLTLKRMIELVMGQVDVEPKGELSSSIDAVAGVIRKRIDDLGPDAGRDVA